MSHISFNKDAEFGVYSLGLCMTWLPAAKIAHKGEKVRFTGKFQGEIIPTVPRGSYLTKALPPSKLNGKETFLFEIFIHFLRFFFVYSISGMIE